MSAPVMIRNVLTLWEGHATSSQPFAKQFVLIFDDVTCIFQHKVWHLYNVNCPPHNKNQSANTGENITTFIQLNLLMKLAPCEGHPMHHGQISASCRG